MLKTRIRLPFRRAIPTPSFRTVIPDGPGWYRYDRSLWRRYPFANANYDGQARYLTAAMLLDFALEAAKAIETKE